MNVVAIEPRTHNIIINKAYDTSKSASQSKQMYRDLKSLGTGTIILVSVKEDGVGALNKRAKQWLAY